MNEMIHDQQPAAQKNAKIIYMLYLVGLIFGLLAIIGVVMAYVNRDDATGWLKSHYQFQIRTFWIGLLYVVVGFILAFAIIGFFILLFYLVWVIVRCVKGMKLLDQEQAHPNPTGWMF